MVLVAGESLIDMRPVCAGNTDAFVPAPGGSPYNVALALGRLGVKCSFLGNFSTDFFGNLLLKTIEDSKVDTSLSRRVEERTTLGFVHLDPATRSAHYDFYTRHTAGCMIHTAAAQADISRFRCCHFGSFSLAVEPIASLMELLLSRSRPDQVISFDPNIRPFLIGDEQTYRRRVDGFMRAATIIKVSEEDLAWLYPGLSPEAFCDQTLRTGPKLVIVTRGAGGALAASPLARAKAPAVPVQVEDTIGAGDTFQAATLAWLSEQRDWNLIQPLASGELHSLLGFASQAAAVTCSRAGCNPPWREELRAAG